MIKSAVRVAREALTVGRQTFPPHDSRTLRHDYTQAQLFALLVLHQPLRTDCRGLATVAAEWQESRKVPGLRRVPHYSPPWPMRYAASQGQKKGNFPPFPNGHHGTGSACRPDRRRAHGGDKRDWPLGRYV